MAGETGAAAQVLTVRSPAFADGGMLQKKNAADDPARHCGGANVSPPLAWSNPPAKTKSFAILMFDPDGRAGLGVSHWLAYGIPASVKGLAEGEAGKPSANFIGGKGTRDNSLYIGPCPPVGDRPHHYVFTVVALDLAPDALKPGLTREELLAAIDGHALGAASIIGKYAR
jgi:Raf kinase inhibitor-like YbhB/YbcL family protein